MTQQSVIQSSPSIENSITQGSHNQTSPAVPLTPEAPAVSVSFSSFDWILIFDIDWINDTILICTGTKHFSLELSISIVFFKYLFRNWHIKVSLSFCRFENFLRIMTSFFLYYGKWRHWLQQKDLWRHKTVQNTSTLTVTFQSCPITTIQFQPQFSHRHRSSLISKCASSRFWRCRRRRPQFTQSTILSGMRVLILFLWARVDKKRQFYIRMHFMLSYHA